MWVGYKEVTGDRMCKSALFRWEFLNNVIWLSKPTTEELMSGIECLTEYSLINIIDFQLSVVSIIKEYLGFKIYFFSSIEKLTVLDVGFAKNSSDFEKFLK